MYRSAVAAKNPSLQEIGTRLSFFVCVLLVRLFLFFFPILAVTRRKRRKKRGRTFPAIVSLFSALCRHLIVWGRKSRGVRVKNDVCTIEEMGRGKLQFCCFSQVAWILDKTIWNQNMLKYHVTNLKKNHHCEYCKNLHSRFTTLLNRGSLFYFRPISTMDHFTLPVPEGAELLWLHPHHRLWSLWACQVGPQPQIPLSGQVRPNFRQWGQADCQVVLQVAIS